MELKLMHIYPNLMNLYGSYANVAVLRRHLEDLGNTVTVENVEIGQEADISSADFLFMGAGTERSQQAALKDFIRFGEAVKTAAQAGTAMLFAGTAMELLGASITDAAGNVRQGIGLADFASVQGSQRILGDVYGTTDLYEAPVVGFMNKCSKISGVQTPLLSSLAMGFGNETAGGAEGFHQDNVFASHLTGPILVKNPPLMRSVMGAIYAWRGMELPESLPIYPYEEQGYTVTVQQLKLRSEQA